MTDVVAIKIIEANLASGNVGGGHDSRCGGGLGELGHNFPGLMGTTCAMCTGSARWNWQRQ